MFKYHHIVNAIPDSLMILNKDGEIVLTNNSWKQFHKKRVENLKGTNTGLTYLKILKKATGKDQEREQQALKGISSVFNNEVDFFEMEYPCHCEDVQQWFLLRVTKIKEDKNMVLLTHIDITAVKLRDGLPNESLSDIMMGMRQEEDNRKEEALALSLSEIIKQNADSLIVTDTDDIIIYVNQATVALTGYNKTALVGKKIDILNSGKHKPEFYENLRHTIQSKKVFRSIIINKKKNNEIYHEETTITPILDEKNEITHYVYSGWDVSERVLEQETLKANEAKLRTIYEFSGYAILIHDGKTFLDCNLEALKMYKCDTKEAFLKLNLEDLYPLCLPDGKLTSVLIKEHLDKVFKTGTIDFELISKRLDGVVFDSEILLTKMELNEKTVIQIIVRDVSLQKTAKRELLQSREKFRALASRISKIREEERTLIARNIHDDLGHSLTALLMDLYLISKNPECQGNDLELELKTMISLVNRAIKTTQSIATDLRPGILDNLGLSAALEWQLEEFVKRNEIKIIVSIQPFTTEHLNEEKATAIFRIFQEILTNVTRHSKATSLQVVLKNDNENIFLLVSDNGVGITLENISDIKSLGLIGMEERTHIVGGEFSIFSPATGGTEINVTIPLAS